MKVPPIIEALNITKHYGSLTAVDDLSLAVPPGVCFGLLGPNGAGKTTLIEIIEDIIPATSGRILFQGRPRSATFREKIGIMFQQTALLAYLTVEETLEIFRKLYQETLNIHALIELCHLDDIRKQFNDKISGGQRQRLLLALALVNQPYLLFLDEPSTGLDPQARRNLWDIIEKIKDQGRSIILTTHYMEEAEQLCDEVAIMDHGRIIAQGPPNRLIEQNTKGVRISLPKEALDGKDFPFPVVMSRTEERVILRTDNINRVIDTLLKLNIDLAHMQVQSPTLETVFLNLTGRQLRD